MNYPMQEKPRSRKITKLAGSSMFPALRQGDVLFLESASPEKIKLGDIVVFEQGEKMVCHRIVNRIKKSGPIIFAEKGDNCFSGTRITANQIIGRVSEVYRGKQRINLHDRRSLLYNIFAAYFFRGFNLAALTKKRIMPQVKIGIVSRALAGLNRRINFLLAKP